MTRDAATVKNERYKIHRGEPGKGVLTPLKREGARVAEPSVGLSLPSPLLSSRDVIANYRLNLIRAFEKEISPNDKPSRKRVTQFLTRYNSGLLLQTTHEKLGHVSWRTFYRWKATFDEGGVKALAPEGGRKAVSKVTDQEKNTLLTLLLHQNRLKTAFAIILTKDHLKRQGIESPSSAQTLRRYIDQFRKEHYDLWVLRREGEKALDDKVLPYIERDRKRLTVGQCLVGDGHRLNFQVINPFTGKPCRATLVLFWDWRSSYPLGWEIMLEENIQCITSAFRNAVITLGKYPPLVYLDNGKGFKANVFISEVDLADTELVGLFGRVGTDAHFAWPYNAKAKPEERFFGIFTDWFERMMPSFIGSSIEDKPAWTKRNEKLARCLHDDWIPEIPEVNEMMLRWREFYIDQPSRGLDGQTPREIFEAGKGPGVDPSEVVYQMLSREIKNVHRNGITFLGFNWYDEALYGYRDHVIIKYSHCDLSQIYVYTIRNEFLCIATPVQKVHPMASESDAPKDMQEVKRQIAFKRSLKAETVRLHHLLGHKSAEMLPWKGIVSEVPNIVEAIEKHEEERAQTSPCKMISPFPEGVVYGEEPKTEKPKYKPPRDWTGFKGDHWEKYDYLKAQDPETLTPDDHEWIAWYKTTSEYEAVYGIKPNQLLSGGLR